jgi:putative endopeptidase
MKKLFLAAASVAALTIASGSAGAQPAKSQAAVKAQASGTATKVPTARKFGTWGFDLAGRNTSVKPGDSFYEYANGGWARTAQFDADLPGTGVTIDTYKLIQEQLRSVIEDSAKSAGTPTGQKVGGLYASFMDEARLEQLDDKPLQADLAAIRAVNSKSAMAQLMGQATNGFGTGMLNLGVGIDAKAPDRYVASAGIGGMGLPDRDYYVTDRFQAQKTAYQDFIGRTLQMVGWADPQASAKAVLDLETRIADATWTRTERRDPNKTYNPMTLAELKALTPGYDWDAYLRGAGMPTLPPGADRVIVGQNTAFPKVARIFAETPLETLKAWQAFHTTRQASPYLSKRFVDNNFAFSKVISGAQQQRPRWNRGVVLVDGSLGEALGKEYVARHFPASSKAQIEVMVANLHKAMRSRIEGADWMSPTTRTEALKKLQMQRVKIGYPNKWRDYSALRIDPADLYGNVERASAFAADFERKRLTRRVDRDEWFMTPQTLNAYFSPAGNEIVFPAAYLQAPAFDPKADPAVNYGAVGAVIGHEITHGFDDQGRQYDASGTLRDWWAPQDVTRFNAEAAKLVAQYEQYEPLPGSKINGKLTLGENIGDQGGVLLALEAYRASLGGKPAPRIDGLTGDQRFFLGWAQNWRNKYRDDTLKMILASDVHSPDRFRVDGVLRNLDAWYQAFNVQPGDKLYIKPEDRARVW